MSARVLFVEVLDTPHADAGDANERVLALRAAGATVSSLVVDLRPRARPESTNGAGDEVSHAAAEARHAVRERLAEIGPELVLVASAAEGGGPFVHALPAGTRARWWPTGIAHSPTAGAALRWRTRRLAPLPLAEPADLPFAGLEWAMLNGPEGYSRLPLWDGDYLLAAGPLGRGGEELLRAFAALAAERDSIDLVVLADPQPEFEAAARRLSVGTRVHFAGQAPRGAEYAWLSSAAALVSTGSGAVAGGHVLRALASGCPMMWLGTGEPGLTVARWLERHQCAAAPAGVRGDAATRALGALLDRGPALTAAIERGRRRAALHRVEPIARRLADVLDGRGERTRRAA